MPHPPRVASARIHGANSAIYGAGGQAVADYLISVAGENYAVVEIERCEGRFSLILDAEWVRLAQSTSNLDLVRDLALPRNVVRAVVAGWATDWSYASSDLEIEHSSDAIPHLRLKSLRPSTSGAEQQR